VWATAQFSRARKNERDAAVGIERAQQREERAQQLELPERTSAERRDADLEPEQGQRKTQKPHRSGAAADLILRFFSSGSVTAPSWRVARHFVAAAEPNT
jgi:hypothetical protein